MKFANLTLRIPQLPIVPAPAPLDPCFYRVCILYCVCVNVERSMAGYHDSFEIPNALRPWVESEVARMQMWGEITRNQARTLLAELTPLLPCHVKVGLRSPKSIIYVQAGSKRFRIGQRAQLIDRPWRIGKPRARHTEGREWF